MAFKETTNSTYKKIKETGILDAKQLEYLSYLYDHGPATNNELVSIIENLRPELTRKDLEVFDRHPAELKKLKVVQVKEKRKCKVKGTVAQVLEVTNHLPVKPVKLNPHAKNILDSSMNSALLAVEVYNKPRATFRSEAYISLMIIAWTKAFHAYFRNTIGDKYYRQGDDGKYVLAEGGEKQTWNLKECMNKYPKLKIDITITIINDS